jgi:ADP-ribosylglycohydrolase
MDLLNRYRGALLGLDAGDALGTTLEFMRPGTFEPMVDMRGGGPFKLKPGQWIDDSSMAQCLAGSLLECNASKRPRPLADRNIDESDPGIDRARPCGSAADQGFAPAVCRL